MFDDLMGFVMDSLAKRQGFTASPNMSYWKPVPIGTPIELRGHLRRAEGRKLFIVATMEHAGRSGMDGDRAECRWQRCAQMEEKREELEGRR